MMRFGYGVGVGYPPTWLDALKITRTSMQTLEPGVTFVLHACLLDEETSTGVLVGGTYVLTSDGPEPLAGAGPVELSAAASWPESKVIRQLWWTCVLGSR